MLNISKLTVLVQDKVILKDFNLIININEIHALMGPNGIGKSTICKVIMGDPDYVVTNGSIIYNNEDLLKMDVTDRARKGIFLLSQSPVEIPGVTNAEMLRMALNQINGSPMSIFDFNKKIENVCKKLDVPKSFIHRGINEGMSGGERKKNELIHLWMLEPKFIILDEIDSGLDVDSLKIVCKSLNEYIKSHECSLLVVSHHADVLKELNVSDVHIISDGKIIKSGNFDLALDIENNGYKQFSRTNEVSERSKYE